MEFRHISVLPAESTKLLGIKPKGVYVDGTLGGGGHAALICEKLSRDGTLIGIDRDREAIEAAKERLKGFECKTVILWENFFNIKEILKGLGIHKIDGAVLDLGVSSHQLDEAKRGFSYNQDAPLDMRMNRADSLTAAEVVNKYSEEKLRNILWEYGEEKNSAKIAKAIVRAREKSEIKTTLELSEIIKKAFPPQKRYGDKHPAKRSFQAIRIEVNGELRGLDKAIEDFVDVLKPEGILSVITFHSLEDRIVKNTFAKLKTGCTCPKDFPVCVCGNKAKIELVNKKPITAGEEELKTNPRAHSAKLRCVRKLSEA